LSNPISLEEIVSTKSVPTGGRESKGLGASVSRDFPCPSCGKDHGCEWYADGMAVYCRRPGCRSGVKCKPGKDGGATFQLRDLGGKPVAPTSGTGKAKKKDRAPDEQAMHVAQWTALTAKLTAYLARKPDRREQLLTHLKLPPFALEQFPDVGTTERPAATRGGGRSPSATRTAASWASASGSPPSRNRASPSRRRWTTRSAG
jgi:hypothetical protein